MRMGGPQSLSGRFREEKNLLLLPGIEPRFPGRSARVPTELARLRIITNSTEAFTAVLYKRSSDIRGRNGDDEGPKQIKIYTAQTVPTKY
jgi:hypothetical protein